MDRLKGRTILVVEDETLIALDVARALKEVGCNVVGPVSTVTEAMSKLTSSSIDAAVLDVNLHAEKCLPIMDTLETGRIPFVIVTGYARETLPVRFQNKPYLGKPFGHMDLVLALDGALRSTGKALAPQYMAKIRIFDPGIDRAREPAAEKVPPTRCRHCTSGSLLWQKKRRSYRKCRPIARTRPAG